MAFCEALRLAIFAGLACSFAMNSLALASKAFPQEAAEFTRRMKGEMPSDFDAKANEFIAKLQANPAKIASRKASQNAIEAFGPLLPEFLLWRRSQTASRLSCGG
jgi:transketolase